ncbi:MAG: hypothetical protein GWN58_58595 [Anaerolineae bacterium]|nr:hypothetical protein [Anaerolineae bacterium]
MEEETGRNLGEAEETPPRLEEAARMLVVENHDLRQQIDVLRTTIHRMSEGE